MRCTLAAYREDQETAIMVFELVIMLVVLALGFVFGRIWEIRREIRRDQLQRRHVALRQHRVGGGLASQSPAG